MMRLEKPAFLLLLAAASGCGLLRRPDVPVDRSQDPRIQQEVEARLANEPSLASGRIRVEAQGGDVLLHGTVYGIGAWKCAIANAQLVEGVRTVVDFLVLERGPRDVPCLAPAEQTVARGAGRIARGD